MWNGKGKSLPVQQKPQLSIQNTPRDNVKIEDYLPSSNPNENQPKKKSHFFQK